MNLDDLVMLADVADAGSFSAAARLRSTTRAVVSRRIARLEETLGVRLLHRNTRKMSLTDVGRRVVCNAQRVRAEVLDVGAIVGDAKTAVEGNLRVASSVDFSRAYVEPAAVRFLAEHPDVELELRIEDSRTDLVSDGFDLAFRVGEPVDSQLVSRRLGELRMEVYASPSYLERRGTPLHPDELLLHDAVVYWTPTVRGLRWMYVEHGHSCAAQVVPRLSVNSGEAVLSAIREGVGIGLLPCFMATRLVAEGSLVRLLSAQKWSSFAPVMALYPARTLLPPKTRAFLDAVVSETEERPL